jgi:argininosuccinate lyase/amino-acid N-acetyltransferase
MKNEVLRMENETGMWGGRFTEAPDALLRRFNDSFSFDRELIAEDIEGSIAWAAVLGDAGVLTARATAKIVRALKQIAASAEPLPGDGHEDVHSYVEAKLREMVGALAGKLHTGRSRNDQVATDLRLWLKKALTEARELALGVARALVEHAVAESATPMPGYTHSKRAEPVTFGHWCLAYAAMLERDASRFADAFARADECPLGSGALAGTPLPIDRAKLATSLGFARPSGNSLDAVSDRDAAAEYLFASTLLLVHLSRLAEDLIFFSSDETGFIELPDRLATGSSRMPQKKNPDVLELVRGHAARSIGELTGLLALLKGLPLAYDKDLQLDKEPLFRTRATLAAALPALAALIAGMKLDRARMKSAASDDLLLATQLMDAIAERGVPFREAHGIVSRRIGEGLAKGKTLAQLGATAEITAADLKTLSVEKGLAEKRALGGTAPQRVKRAAITAKRRLNGKSEGRR